MPSKPTYSFADEPAPIKKAQEPAPAQKLLDWLQRWRKPTVSIRDIRIYGPLSLRNQESASSSAEVLVRHGWLVPTETRRRDWRHGQVVRKGPIAHPTVAA